MKEVFIIHKLYDRYVVQAMFLPDKDEYEPLTEYDLEDIFKRHNLYSNALSLTGYMEYIDDMVADYVYDPYLNQLWRCMPVGWKLIH